MPNRNPRHGFWALPPNATPLERALTPIVRGQIRSYFSDHPVLTGHELDLAISGISKRIVRDLAAGTRTGRLGALFVEVATANNADSQSVEFEAAPMAGNSVEPYTAETSEYHD